MTWFQQFSENLSVYARVYPTDLSAKDARQSLRRTEAPKADTVEEDEVAQEIKQKGDSLRRVPRDENPVLKDMDARADVKVFFSFSI